MNSEYQCGVEPRYRHLQAVQLVRRCGARSLLDVGCRDCGLHETIRRHGGEVADLEYAGADIFQNSQGTVDFVGDVTRGIPVDDASYDMVAALEVLEHVDDFWGALGEIDRIARRYILISLPNVAHFVPRLRFLLTGRISGKYDFSYGRQLDRHRWFTVLGQCDRAIMAYCTERDYRLEQHYLSCGGRRTRLVERMLRTFGFSPSWHVWSMLYLLDKAGSEQGLADAGGALFNVNDDVSS